MIGMETFAERFKRLRLAREMTQLDVAKRTGVTEGTVRQVESGGIQEPGLFWSVKAARALGVTPEALAFGDPAKSSRQFWSARPGAPVLSLGDDNAPAESGSPDIHSFATTDDAVGYLLLAVHEIMRDLQSLKAKPARGKGAGSTRSA